MSSSVVVSITLIILFIAALPAWKHSKMWGGGYTPCTFLGLMIAAHMYTVMFTKA